MGMEWFSALHQCPNTTTSCTTMFCASKRPGLFCRAVTHNRLTTYRIKIHCHVGNSWVFTCYCRKRLKGKQCFAFIIQPYNPIWMSDISSIVPKLIKNFRISYPFSANAQNIFCLLLCILQLLSTEVVAGNLRWAKPPPDLSICCQLLNMLFLI